MKLLTAQKYKLATSEGNETLNLNFMSNSLRSLQIFGTNHSAALGTSRLA